jgi:hypothetical protein
MTLQTQIQLLTLLIQEDPDTTCGNFTAILAKIDRYYSGFLPPEDQLKSILKAVRSPRKEENSFEDRVDQKVMEIEQAREMRERYERMSYLKTVKKAI